ncbi:uncharacterized protein EV154DRAFT_519922 [Mucor mucedo]|uniref:uncharacterized protein n=1 Tax=Mucor mucedo TaxID=29922 RepID=UPI0022204C07|nr:uncharacterized protein EV154DRAFT_519922 [Mucor mucedo]KAI7887755.1 hypothetical protein EV154DRAFT_519922 [Mucor mucedo]
MDESVPMDKEEAHVSEEAQLPMDDDEAHMPVDDEGPPITTQEMDRVDLEAHKTTDETPPITTQEMNQVHLEMNEAPPTYTMDSDMGYDDYGYDGVDMYEPVQGEDLHEAVQEARQEEEEEQEEVEDEYDEEEILAKTAPLLAKKLGTNVLKMIRLGRVQMEAFKRECETEVAKVKASTQDVLEACVIEDFRNRVIEKLNEQEEDYVEMNEMLAYTRRFELHENQVSKQNAVVIMETAKVNREIEKLEREFQSMKKGREEAIEADTFLNSVKQLIHSR